jgi:16S rRNA (cytosine967-C5)-methyltransferase
MDPQPEGPAAGLPEPAQPLSTPEPPAAAVSEPGLAPGPAAAPRPKPDPRDEACSLLVRLDSPEARARELLDESLRHWAFTPEDAALLQELVHGTLRRRALVDWHLSHVSHRPLEALSPWVRALLRLSLYQILCLDRIPPAAAVDSACDIARRHGHDGVVKFVNGCLREVCRQKAEDKLPPLPAHPVLRLAIESSHPLWMAERLTASFGWERAAQALNASNQPAPLTLRVNPQRARRDEVASRLHQAGFHVEPCKHSPWGLKVREAGDTRRLPGFLDGDFHVQDESAQLVGLLMGLQPGWQVADVCAAPGGKLALIAELLGRQGKLWAFDRKAGALDKIHATLRRQGLANIHGETRDALYPREDLFGRLDGVLVDAPCSALGVLRRRAEARWQVRPESLPSMVDRQARLLLASAQYLKPGGVLVYTVSSFDEDECEGVVARFLEHAPGYAFERAGGYAPHEVCTRDGFLRCWPGQDGMDGVFAARLRRLP